MENNKTLVSCEFCAQRLLEVEDSTTILDLKELVKTHKCHVASDKNVMWLKLENGTFGQYIYNRSKENLEKK